MGKDYDKYTREQVFFDEVLTEQVLEEISHDIADWCINQTGMSYYDLVTFCYDNDKHAWIYALRKKKIRGFIALLLREKRKSDRVKYKNRMDESVGLLVEAQDRYFERNGSDEEIMDRRLEAMEEE